MLSGGGWAYAPQKMERETHAHTRFARLPCQDPLIQLHECTRTEERRPSRQPEGQLSAHPTPCGAAEVSLVRHCARLGKESSVCLVAVDYFD